VGKLCWIVELPWVNAGLGRTRLELSPGLHRVPECFIP
jgi:hypothetical protein